MEQKLSEIIERLDRIEQSLNMLFSIERGREQMKKGEYAPNPFDDYIGCTCGTVARCYKHFPHGSMPGDVKTSFAAPQWA
jgi:hypothetical protein